MVIRPTVGRRLPSPRAFDAAVIGSLAAADLIAEVVVRTGGHAPSAPLSPLAVAVALAAAGLFWWRRSHPLGLIVGSVVAIVVANGAARPGLLTEHTGVPLAVAVYAAGAWSGLRRRATALVSVMGALVFLGLSQQRHTTGVQAAAVATVLIALPFVVGVAARSRRAYIEEVEQRLAAAERERDERARRAAEDERRHIARELHDLVAHHVSLIGVQAGAARTALEQAPAVPEATRRALIAIEASSRSAVGEMRYLLDALRGADTEADLQPAQAGRRLGPLFDDFRGAGLEVTPSLHGDAAALSPLQDLCCYRLIEEALTNVTRHSRATRAWVWVDVGEDRVDVGVRDEGPSTPGPGGTGRGLVGLRERVELCGGVIAAGPTEPGFAVQASMPRMAP